MTSHEEGTRMQAYENLKSSYDDDDSALSLYLREINNIPLLSRNEEVALATQARMGDDIARNKLAQSHLRFVVNVAKKFQNRGLPLSDLISEGNIGLLHAIERFEPEKGYHFISYAVWWIRQSIMKALVEKSCGIRLPQNRVSDLAQIHKVRKMMQADGLSDDPRQVAKILNMDMNIVKDLINISREHASLDAPINSDNEKTLGQMIQDTIYDAPDKNVDEEELKNSINTALSSLSPKEVSVLELRFGLNGQKAHSLKEIGEMFNLTKERIRQIEKRAMDRLKHPSRIARLLDLLPKL